MAFGVYHLVFFSSFSFSGQFSSLQNSLNLWIFFNLRWIVLWHHIIILATNPTQRLKLRLAQDDSSSDWILLFAKQWHFFNVTNEPLCHLFCPKKYIQLKLKNKIINDIFDHTISHLMLIISSSTNLNPLLSFQLAKLRVAPTKITLVSSTKLSSTKQTLSKTFYILFIYYLSNLILLTHFIHMYFLVWKIICFIRTKKRLFLSLSLSISYTHYAWPSPFGGLKHLFFFLNNNSVLKNWVQRQKGQTMTWILLEKCRKSEVVGNRDFHITIPQFNALLLSFF